MQVERIQQALVSAGYNLGKTGASGNGIDGAWGAKSIAATRSFQTFRRLPPTGVMDTKTLSALFPLTDEPFKKAAPPWHAELLRLKGLREGPGAKDNPTILGWATKLGLWYPHDSIAWCGLVQAHAVSSTLPDEPLPTNALGARNWMSFGVPVAPTPGAIMVFWRGSKDGWQGHVAQYLRETGDAYCVLGGNQADSISETWIAKARLLGARWPSTYPLPENVAARIAGAAGPLSANEA